jgi:predicted deacylase
MTPTSEWFPSTYEAARARFQRSLTLVQRLWPNGRHASHRISGAEHLTIDWIMADGLSSRERLLIITTGLHGVEGYVGAAVMNLFLSEVLPRCSPDSCGLLLIHPVNPWGMKHLRRTNRDNVDLNRSFAADHDRQGEFASDHYDRLQHLLNPQGPISSLRRANTAFYLALLQQLLMLGPRRVRAGTLLGQYHHPHGVYFGGRETPEETRLVMDLLRATLRDYGRTVVLDVHSGYGPRYQMSLVNSCLEPRETAEISRVYDYPRVVKTDAVGFYRMQGDMLDWLYRLVDSEFRGKYLYATSLEFGTLGDSMLDGIRSLQAVVHENRLHWHGSESDRARERVEGDFLAAYFPSDEKWRAKAIADARLALWGILSAEGFIVGPRTKQEVFR